MKNCVCLETERKSEGERENGKIYFTTRKKNTYVFAKDIRVKNVRESVFKRNNKGEKRERKRERK